jgi:hypothetical protein
MHLVGSLTSLVLSPPHALRWLDANKERKSDVFAKIYQALAGRYQHNLSDSILPKEVLSKLFIFY